MTTRLDLRTAVRRRLEDTGATPLWDDATLNDLLADAMRRYGARFPREVTATVAVTAGATSFAVTPAIEADRVLRVFDDEGVHVPRQAAFAPNETAAAQLTVGQAWRWWNSTLILTRAPAADGSWTVEHLAARSLPADDVTAVEVIPGDEEIVVLLAVTAALRRRAVEDGKRGLGRAGNAIAMAADRAEAGAERLMGARRRRARGGWIA